MSGENQTTATEADRDDAALQAAFSAGFAGVTGAGEPAERTAQHAAAAVSPAAAGDAGAGNAGETGTTKEGEEQDEFASLPPRARALFTELEQLVPTLRAVPNIVHRVSKAEGRLGDVNRRLQALPTPAPTPAPKIEIEEVEALRREGLPEVATAIDKALERALAEIRPKESAKAPAAPSQPSDDNGEAPTELLDAEFPGWLKVAGSKEFKTWVDQQQPEYAAKIRATTSEGVMLAALFRFDTDKRTKTAAQAAARDEAERLVRQREARAAAAVVPTGSRRAPAAPTTTEHDAFMAGFRGG